MAPWSYIDHAALQGHTGGIPAKETSESRAACEAAGAGFDYFDGSTMGFAASSERSTPLFGWRFGSARTRVADE